MTFVLTPRTESGITAARPAPPRDFDGLYKALLDAHPREALTLLCGARLDGREVIAEAATEFPRQRPLQSDRVFVVPKDHDDPGAKADVYHLEIQLRRTRKFQERMMSYWVSLAHKYDEEAHCIHQVVLWPEGGGYSGHYVRDGARLDYHAVNIPDDFDADALLASPLAALALWSRKPPPDVVERFAAVVEELDGDEQLLQIELGMLVGGSLAARLVEALRRRGMTHILETTPTGQEIARKNHDEGREATQVDDMRIVLRLKFGDLTDLDDLAKRLVKQDHTGNLMRIVDGATLDELRA